MLIRVGYELIYRFAQATPVILMLDLHPSRVADVVEATPVKTEPVVPVTSYQDSFGNRCTRLVAPPGLFRISASATLRDHGRPDPEHPSARQHPVEELPPEVLMYLLGSRYCETDRLSEVAWALFGQGPTGWARVQAICDFVHQHIAFNYADARPTRTAYEAWTEKRGVCRDYTHLAVAFCRSMNIPARYCAGYLGDIGVPPPHGPMDFSAWFEAYLDGAWHVFDPRNNTPRIGRVLMARGRDAVDVPITNTFGPNELANFRVWTDEVPETTG